MRSSARRGPIPKSGKLRVATVGTGYFSQFHYDAWARIPEVELVAVADLDRGKAEDCARKYGMARAFVSVADMLDAVEPDLLDIIVPPAAHEALIDEAIARRIPTICQKPFCATLAQAEAATARAQAAGVPVIVHENFRFQPWHVKAREIICAGTLGDVHEASFRMRPGDGQGPDAYLSRQPYFQRMPRFLIRETGIHFIDVFRFLLGEIESVYAQLERLNPVIAGEDAGIVLFAHRGGARSLLDANRLVDHKAGNRRLTMGEMHVEGTRATLTLDGDGCLWLRRHGSNTVEPVANPWPANGFAGDSVLAFQGHVVAHLLKGTPVANSAQDYLRNLRIEEAVYASNREGRKISV